MGSYDAWCRVVRDAVVWAGGADPAETQDTLRESADVERDELRELLTAWHAVLGDRAVTARELLDAAHGAARTMGARIQAQRAEADPAGVLLDALRGVMPDGREPSPHGVGNALRRAQGQIADGRRLVVTGTAHGGARRYRVVQGR